MSERNRRAASRRAIGATLLVGVGIAFPAVLHMIGTGDAGATSDGRAAIVTVYEQKRPRGLMVTSGGWAYCLQLRALARRSGYSLMCGRYAKDGYVGYGLRSRRHLDWGNAAYLRELATAAGALHRRVGGELVLVGVSYSGFGVATLATHHPELRPDRLIVIDSYLDLVARRRTAGPGKIGLEIDEETGGSAAALIARNVRVDRLARLVASGTKLRVVWSISADEARMFKGATCNVAANAAVLQRLADRMGRRVTAWVTESEHGHDLWDHGRSIMRDVMPGRRVSFRAGAPLPAAVAC